MSECVHLLVIAIIGGKKQPQHIITSEEIMWDDVFLFLCLIRSEGAEYVVVSALNRVIKSNRIGSFLIEPMYSLAYAHTEASA